MIRQRIKNTLSISCSGLDLTTVKDIEFYVRQGEFFRCYYPEVVSPSQMVVVIPFEDAQELENRGVSIQIAYTDQDGNPRASDTMIVSVRNLLKEEGYGSV